MRYLILLITLCVYGCSGGVAPLIKSAADTSKTVSQTTENLLESEVISVDDAAQVHQTIAVHVLPRIQEAEAAYGQWRIQSEIYGINNGGDKTAEQYINFANDYLNGLCSQLKIESCQGGN